MMTLTTFYLIRTGSSSGPFELRNKSSVPLSEGGESLDQLPAYWKLPRAIFQEFVYYFYQQFFAL
jgi:hypothetical protein